MLTTRVIRSLARQSFNHYIANPSPSEQCLPSSAVIYRNLCVPRPSQGASSPAPAHDTKPNATEEKPVSDPSSTSSSASHPSPSQKDSSESETNTAKKETIPDVPSTSWSSIGFEEQDAKDPNKWKKFAWKYAGAVLLFMISYKTLHWYTDRLEADGKRRRKEMEEDREIAQQILTTNPDAERFPYLEPLKDIPKLPDTSSELDELYAYKAELETKLQSLRSQGRTSEIKAQTKEVESELKDLADDIRMLEMKKAT